MTCKRKRPIGVVCTLNGVQKVVRSNRTAPTNFQSRSRFLCHNLTVTPDVEGRAMHPCCLACHSGRSAECPPNPGCEVLGNLCTFLLFHGYFSMSIGRSPELS